MNEFVDKVAAYRRALDADDEAAARTLLAGVPDGQLDGLLAALETAGISVSEVELEATAIQRQFECAGMVTGVAEQASIIATGSFPEYVVARAAALGIGADTIIEHAEERGEFEDDADLDIAYAYVADILAGREPERRLSDSSIRVLARVLETPSSVVESMLGRQ